MTRDDCGGAGGLRRKQPRSWGAEIPGSRLGDTRDPFEKQGDKGPREASTDHPSGQIFAVRGVSCQKPKQNGALENRESDTKDKP